MNDEQPQVKSSPKVKPLRSLRPKPRTPPEPRDKPQRNSHSGCYVSICIRENCQLRSHHNPASYVTAVVATNYGKVPASDSLPEPACLRRRLLPEITFADPRMNDSEFKNLFHQYLSFDMPRIVALMAPPTMLQTPDQSIRTKTQGIAQLGSLAPVYFLLFVSMAHILELVRRQQLEPDRISAKIYGRLMRLVREKLSIYNPSEAPDLVLSVLALCSFDMSLGQYAAVDHHRTALQQLVSQVGLYALGRSTAYVLSWDRLIAAYIAKPPLYAQMPNRQLLRAPHHGLKYGVGFITHEDELDLDPDVRHLCDCVCRALEITEAEEWTFRPDRLDRPYSAGDIHYLYFLRDYIQNTCAILQSRPLHNDTKSKPVLLAAMIVQYVVLGKNDLTWYSTRVADRLYTELVQHDLEVEWRGCEDVLCWLMCILVAMPGPWKWRLMAQELFYHWREQQGRGERRQVNWPLEGAANLCDPEMFMWSKVDFDDNLETALSELQKRRSRDTTECLDPTISVGGVC